MALPTQNWRAFNPVAMSGTIDGLLDAIYNNGQAATYADGTGRTPGSGSAWTWNRQQVTGTTFASWGVPPTNTLNTAYIVAGNAGATGSPTMMAGLADTFLVNRICISMNKNSGSPISLTNGWNNASPFGAGQFSGYIVGGTQVTGTLYMWECQEAFIAQFAIAGGASTQVIGGGAFIDPISTNAANAESDGRLYSIFATGVGGNWNTNWAASFTTTTYGVFKAGGAVSSAGLSRHQVFTPGAVNTSTSAGFPVQLGLPSTLVSPGGEIPLIPFPVTGVGGASPFYGQLRNIYFTKAGVLGQAFTNGATINGYLLSPNNAANANVLLAY